MILEIQPAQAFRLEATKIASDKSISHRSVIFSLLSNQTSKIKNYLQGEDTLNTLEIAKNLGLQVKTEGDTLLLTPSQEILEPKGILECGNAGTAIRLYVGLLSAQKGLFVLSGDCYLNERPMKRVTEPLKNIGAEIYGRDEGNLAPLV
ncbi:MAG: 3-phosphoshikimate 1-carboxyvinyltransferase, partial [Helicobacter sp.]|nr:3-phosphoshikimate 1-carboxyvinyltransferase [Helicobacter sp.]